jgi:hypothetical protein
MMKNFNNDMKNFDRDFERIRKASMGSMFFGWLMTAALICLMIWGGIKLIGGVQEHGLKGVIENIWEGPQATDTNETVQVTDEEL